MPYYFKFYDRQGDDDPKFSCRLKAERCSGPKEREGKGGKSRGAACSHCIAAQVCTSNFFRVLSTADVGRGCVRRRQTAKQIHGMYILGVSRTKKVLESTVVFRVLLRSARQSTALAMGGRRKKLRCP